MNTDNPDGAAGGSGSDSNTGGGIQTGDDAPTCGASRLAAEQVVVESVVEVPEEVSEEVTEEVPELVTEEVTEEVTTVKPTVLYIMFDQSMSMGGPPWGTSNLWTPAVAALKSFVNDSKSAGLGVALQYFPISGGSCSNGGGYSTPEVKVATLPAAATKFNASLDQHSASGVGTPIEGALRGVTEFCKKYQTDHPEQQCVSVLVTDGKPELASGCSENNDSIAAIAASAHAQGVTTFAVGLQGASFTLLDKIAKQGGAPDCDTNNTHYACDVSAGASGLLTALNTIREKVVTSETHTVTHTVTHEVVHTVTHTEVHTQTVQHVEQTQLPCEWAIPASSTDGETFDPNKVNIRLSADDAQTTFVHVSSKDACVDNAWYYDDEANPTRFIACDQTCESIEGLSTAQIDILLGCATIGPS